MNGRTPIALLFFLLNGCALHAPMSEMVIFRDPMVYPDSTHKGGVGLSIISGSTNDEIINDPSPEASFTDVELMNRRKSGGALYFSSYEGMQRLSFSVSLGIPILGADMTLPLTLSRIDPSWYLTLSGSFNGGGQVIVQKRILQRRRIGASLGLNARRITHWLVTNEPTTTFTFLPGPDIVQHINSLGLKGLLVYRAGTGPRGYDDGIFSMNIFAGYAPETKQPVISIAFGWGAFSKRKGQLLY